MQRAAWKPKDLIVIGGGINGAGIAADAAGRAVVRTHAGSAGFGLRDLSASSKLIHGGLRYLEHYEVPVWSAALV